MLKTVVEHAGELPGPMHVVLVATHASFSHPTSTGFKEIWQASREGTGNRAEALAAVPSAISHVALDALYERPVQAEVVQLLLLPSSHKRFTSCVVVHGMGGTGKTVTAVAAVQDGVVRQCCLTCCQQSWFLTRIHRLRAGGFRAPDCSDRAAVAFVLRV